MARSGEGAAGVKRRLVLCAYGITASGQRRLLAFRLAQNESTQAWEAFLSRLQTGSSMPYSRT